MAGTLFALVLALTVGLFDIHEVLSFTLVTTTLVVECIGSLVLATTLLLVLRSRRAGRVRLRGTLSAASPSRRPTRPPA